MATDAQGNEIVDTAIVEPDVSVTLTPSGQYVSTYSDAFTLDEVLNKPSQNKAVPAGVAISGDVIVIIDTETTGVEPWNDRVLVVGLWDISEPESQIASFWGLDEQKVITDAVAWLNAKNPTILVSYNFGFDERHLLSRAMFYQLQMPWWEACHHQDMMDILKRGVLSGPGSSQSPGSVEQWETYFWDTKKIYTIEQCFQGLLDDGTPEKFMLRNKDCCFGEGSMYKLFLYIMGNMAPVSHIMAPVAERGAEIQAGHAQVVCSNCKQVNDFDLSLQYQACFVCGFHIPNPSPNQYIQEYVRPLDVAQIQAGATPAKTTAAKASVATPAATTATTKSKTTVTLTAAQKKAVAAIYASSASGTNVLNAEEKAAVAKIYNEAA